MTIEQQPEAAMCCPVGPLSYSRAHVSGDNPYSESQFKTMKYRPVYPARFGCIKVVANTSSAVLSSKCAK